MNIDSTFYGMVNRIRQNHEIYEADNEVRAMRFDIEAGKPPLLVQSTPLMSLHLMSRRRRHTRTDS